MEETDRSEKGQRSLTGTEVSGGDRAVLKKMRGLYRAEMSGGKQRSLEEIGDSGGDSSIFCCATWRQSQRLSSHQETVLYVLASKRGNLAHYGITRRNIVSLEVM